MELNLFNQNNEATMSSREVAELTYKMHKNVLVDCDNLNMSYKNIGLAEIAAGVYYHQSTGKQKHRVYLLTKIQTLDLMTGYSTELRIKVNRRWVELESKEQIKLPQSFSEALQLAADQAKQLELQAPKVNFADNIIKSEENISMANMAKLLNTGRNKLFKTLRDDKVLMSNGAYKNTPYQRFIDSGYFTVTEKAMDKGKGLFIITLITPKGQMYLSNKYKF